MHDVVIVGVPLIVILAGIIFGRSDIKDLRREMDGLRSQMNWLRGEMTKRFDRIDDHLIQFHSIIGKLDGRLDAVERHQG